MALGSLTLPSVSTGFSSDSKSMVPVSIQGMADKVQKMSPLETMQEVFLDIRGGISDLGSIFSDKISGLNKHLAFRLETLNNTMSNIGSIAAKDFDIQEDTFDIVKENEADDDKNKSLADEPKQKGSGILAGLKEGFGSLMDFLTPKSEIMKVGLIGLAVLGIMTQLDKISAFLGDTFKFIADKILPKAKIFYEDMKETTMGVFNGLFEKDKGLFSLLGKGFKDIADGFKEDDPVKKLQGMKTIFIDGTIKAISVLGDGVFGTLNAAAKALGMDTPGLRKLQLQFRSLPETIDAFVLRSIEKSKAQLKEITDTNSLPEATLVAARQIYDDLGAPVLNSLNKLVGIVFKPFMSDEYYKSVMSADFSSTSIKASLKVSLDKLSNVMNKLGDSLNVFANEMIDSINEYLPNFMKMNKIPLKNDQYEIDTLASMEKQKLITPEQYEPGGFMYEKYQKQRSKVIEIDPLVVKPVSDFEKDFGVGTNVGDVIDGTYQMKDKTKEIKTLEKDIAPPGNITVITDAKKITGDTVVSNNTTVTNHRVDSIESSSNALLQYFRT